MRSLAFLLLLIWACLGATIQQARFTFPKDKDQDHVWLTPLAIGQSVTSFSLAENVKVNVSVCINPYVLAAEDSDGWGHKCAYYGFFPTTGDIIVSGAFPLLANTPYSVTVKLSEANQIDNLTINVVGDQCADPMKMPPTCTDVAAMSASVNWTDYQAVMTGVQVAVDSEVLIRLPDVPSNFGNITIHLSQPLELAFAVNTVPPTGYTPGSDFVIEYPLPGFYYLRIHNPTLDVVSFDLTVTALECAPGKFGPNCEDDIQELATSTAGEVLTGSVDNTHYKHFQLTVTNSTVWVSVMKTSQDNTTDERDPKIFVQYGNIASEASNIVHGCTRAKCPNVDAVKIGSVNGTFYVAIEAVNLTVGYYIWANAMCPYDCYSNMGNGQCITDDTKDNYGLCQCNIGWAGADCNTSIGLTIEYIVLIVIGSLVVLSAIIGFIAWAYMRRKRTVQYDTVS